MTQPKRLSEEELEKMKSIHRETPLTGDGFGWGFVAKLFEHIQALESEHKREVEGLREAIKDGLNCIYHTAREMEHMGGIEKVAEKMKKSLAPNNKEDWVKKCADTYMKYGGASEEMAFAFAKECANSAREDAKTDDVSKWETPEDMASSDMSYWEE